MQILIQLLRPKHWFKNVFVLFPLLFSGALWTPGVWTSVLLSIFAAACFCLWASAVYILNDICDVESDRQHPRKCNRPIASGKVSIPTGIIISIILAVIPFAALPWGLGRFLALTPLGSLAGGPLSLYAGLADPATILAAQLFWNALLWPLALWRFAAMRERMVSYGG